MPTECERSIAMPHEGQQQHQQQQLLQAQQQIQEQHMENSLNASMESNNSRDELNGDMSTSQTSTTSTSSTTPPTTIATTNGHNGNNNNNNGSNGTGGARKTSITSPDPTAYVAKARVTRPTPPPPSYNPMQFVQIKPCNLYQTAQQQLKKAEEVKKIKEIKKEEPEDWQNNLDNWKSSRRKRVEHIIDRVVEVKKLELEEHDRTRRKSKTLSEMIEERGDRGARGRVKLASLAVYNEDESNDLSDLGIGTSSASGKSSLSEDYDNNSVMSDNPELEKPIFEHNLNNKEHSTTREYISSPGYDTSSSTAPASSPDPCEYTYEGAIQDYKQRVSRATSGGGIAANYLNNSNAKAQQHATSKESTPERLNNSNNGQSDIYPTRRGSKIEDRLIGFEVTSPSDSQEVADKQKVDVPKIDISKRKEMFEMANASAGNESKPFSGSNGNSNAPRVTLRERFTTADSDAIVPEQVKKDVKRLSGDITSIRDRLQSLEQQQNLVNNTANGATKSTPPKLVDIPVPPLKDRLSSLQNAVTKEEVKKPPVVLIDARQLEIMKNEEATAQQRLKQLETTQIVAQPAPNATAVPTVKEEEIVGAATMDRDDSGILTSDDIEADTAQLESEQEQQLNAAIAALALEEKQLEEAANAVNQIEAEFAEHSSTANVTAAKMPAAIVSATNEPQCDMEISVSSTNNLLNPNSSSNSSDSSNNGSSRSCGKMAEAAETVETVESVPKCANANNDLAKTDAVLGSACNLRRKPSNEMVHARNLLKMFKETFQSDIELDEEAEHAQLATSPSNLPFKVTKPIEIKTSAGVTTPKAALGSPTNAHNSPIATQIFQASSPLARPQSPFASVPTQTQSDTTPTALPKPTAGGGTPSMIPRSINPTGKPPMSPQSARYHPAKLVPQSPTNSPTPARKPESQFSINGRVEIFNSKNMIAPEKQLPPTNTAKKPYLPHITTPLTYGQPEPEPSASASASTSNGNDGIALPQQQLITAAAVATEPQSISNQTTSFNAKSMPVKAVVNEPQEIRSISKDVAQHRREQQPQNDELQLQQQQQPEVVMCAPPVTIVNPDELPKPNTVKALSNCFAQETVRAATPPTPPPKPLPRSRIPQITPPQSPTPAKRNVAVTPPTIAPKPIFDVALRANNTIPKPEEVESKKLSTISNTSTLSSDTMGHAGPFETTAIVHTPPMCIETRKETPKTPVKSNSDPLTPNESLTPVIMFPAEIPPLMLCAPNDSSLFKLASSTPTSPTTTPLAPLAPIASFDVDDKPSADDIAICSNLLACLGTAPSTKSLSCYEPIRQETVVEEPCAKLDVSDLPPFSQIPTTSFFEITPEKLKLCDGATPPSTPIKSLKPAYEPQRQITITEEPCDKVDVSDLPPYKQRPCTIFREVSPIEIRRCDNFNTASSPTKTTTPTKTNSKPNSPIMEARAAHSKALIETCEKIIAEERLASNHLKSTLPTAAAKSTPVLQRKSKIPKPICCIGAADSMTTADHEHEKFTPLAEARATTPERTEQTRNADDEGLVIARLHVVETQIKVTTTTPPASPKVNVKTPPKKTKTNIFDFLKKNFGHHDDTPAATASTDVSPSGTGDTIKYDEIHTVENSKFYIPTDDVRAPPPLPATPAPVNIEITKKIITDEILEEANSEQALSQEINDMLDDELNKLSLESASSSEVGGKHNETK